MPKIGLLGFPLGHSFSKSYFEAKFQSLALSDYHFQNFEIPDLSKLPELWLNEPALIGCSVTIPHKVNIIPYLKGGISLEAEAIGAVNCIKKIQRNGEILWEGHNTDAFGFQQSIKPFLEPQHDKALILGTGGASKAVHYVLGQIGVNCWHVSRGESHPTQQQFNYQDLNETIIQHFKLIINASPVGTFPHINECPAIPYQGIGKGHLLYDLVYNPDQSLFLQKGKAQGAVCINGLSMLKQQAEKAWSIWHQD